MAEMEESFGSLLKQLPRDTEVPGLIDDISSEKLQMIDTLFETNFSKILLWYQYLALIDNANAERNAFQVSGDDNMA